MRNEYAPAENDRAYSSFADGESGRFSVCCGGCIGSCPDPSNKNWLGTCSQTIGTSMSVWICNFLSLWDCQLIKCKDKVAIIGTPSGPRPMLALLRLEAPVSSSFLFNMGVNPQCRVRGEKMMNAIAGRKKARAAGDKVLQSHAVMRPDKKREGPSGTWVEVRNSLGKSRNLPHVPGK